MRLPFCTDYPPDSGMEYFRNGFQAVSCIFIQADMVSY